MNVGTSKKLKKIIDRLDEVNQMVNDGHTREEIIKELGVTYSTYQYLRERYGFPKPRHKHLKVIDEDVLHRKYVIEKYNICQIAEQLGYSSATIAKKLKFYNIPVRDPLDRSAEKFRKMIKNIYN